MSLIPKDLTPFACAVMKNLNPIKTTIPKKLILKLLQKHSKQTHTNRSISPKKTILNFPATSAYRINKVAEERLQANILPTKNNNESF